MRQFVGVILVKPDGSVLSQHRDNIPTVLGPDTWRVVGGAQEKDDGDLRTTAVRELGEETGYKIDKDELELLVKDKYATERGVQVERTIFWGRCDGIQEIHTNEGQEIRFINPSELGTLQIYTGYEGFF